MHNQDGRSQHISRWTRSSSWVYLLVICLAIFGGIALYVYKFAPASNPGISWQCQHAAQMANPVAAENSCPGTNSWRLDHPTGSENAIEGFTAPVSVNAGEKVSIYVSTTAPAYTFQVYRMGWYQGLGGRLVYSSSSLPAINQPPPIIDPTTRMVSCSNWQHPIVLQVPTSWVSGFYVVKLLSSAGFMRYTSFVVRDDASHSPILFQTSVLTYQAYNFWGGYSLYRGTNADGQITAQARSYVVSFDRPYDRSAGLGDFPLYSEYNLLRWIERSGYNVSYTTDIDTDMRGDLLLQHRLYIAAGHDEYWSTAMRDHVTSARDKGVSLAFFGGNDVYWHVRLQNSPLGADRELICYKPGYYAGGIADPIASIDPGEDTVLWRDQPLDEPENTLVGAMYGGAVNGYAPLVLASGATLFIVGTTLQVGSSLPGLIGGEYDRISQDPTASPSISVLASSPLRCVRTTLCPASGTDIANATLYTAPSGARVFDAGTFYWGWGLDTDSFGPIVAPHRYSTPAFQQFTANLLAYLLKVNSKEVQP